MRFLRAVYRILGEIAGEGDYARYCEHLRARHPGTRLPTEREFYLARLQEKYSRPSRCC
jgi:uncharacterized short protein YbdD (DUF466 family)